MTLTCQLDDLRKLLLLTMKLYSPGQTKEVMLTFDQTTEITSSEDADANANLKVGTAVDLRYDPKTNKALYIYVY